MLPQARDDPICPYNAVPFHTFDTNASCILVATPTGLRWLLRLCAHLHALSQASGTQTAGPGGELPAVQPSCPSACHFRRHVACASRWSAVPDYAIPAHEPPHPSPTYCCAGGHLGWVDTKDWSGPPWTQNVMLDFLQACLRLRDSNP